MFVSCRFADAKPRRDLAVGRALRNQIHDLTLPRRQRDRCLAFGVAHREKAQKLEEPGQRGTRKRDLALADCPNGPRESQRISGPTYEATKPDARGGRRIRAIGDDGDGRDNTGDACDLRLEGQVLELIRAASHEHSVVLGEQAQVRLLDMGNERHDVHRALGEAWVCGADLSGIDNADMEVCA